MILFDQEGISKNHLLLFIFFLKICFNIIIIKILKLSMKKFAVVNLLIFLYHYNPENVGNNISKNKDQIMFVDF